MTRPAPSGRTARLQYLDAWLRLLRENLRRSLWPVPLGMMLAAFVLVQATRALDERVAGHDLLQLWWLHSGTGDDARNLLTTVVSAIITISGVVFSITIVALSLAANQFGSRLVRTYMADLRTKLSLGWFLLTVVFCLLALRLVSSEMGPGDVPHVTITTGLALGVVCVLVLLFFLHMVARSIIADEVVRRVAQELQDGISSLPLRQPGASLPRHPALPADFEAGSGLLRSQREGYVQEVRYEELARCATDAQLVIRLDVTPGDYVCDGGWIGRVWPGDRCSPELLRVLRDTVMVGEERTPVQDLGFALRHLVDIALRALSPGINDANTALVVIDRLRGALARLLERSLPDGVFCDDAGQLRLLAYRHCHAELLATALRPIRDAAAKQPLVIVSMLEALAKLSEHTGCGLHAEAIEAEAEKIAAAARVHDMPRSESEAVERALQEVRERLQAARSAAG